MTPTKQIVSSRKPAANLKSGEWRFTRSPNQPDRLHTKFENVPARFTADTYLFNKAGHRHSAEDITSGTFKGANYTFLSTVDIIHTATEPDDHALEIVADAAGFGDVKALEIDYITGAIDDGQDEGIILINIDESLADGGEVFGLEVLATEGSANIWGLKAAALVGPIHQDSGVFTDMDSALVNATDRLAEFISTSSDIAIFVADNDTVTIGNTAKFEEIEFLLATVSSGGGIRPTFEFSTGASPTTWDDFTPVDGTDGLKHNGIIAWDDGDISTWAVDAASEYLIRITRTRNSLSTVPIEDKVQIASTTTYTWDKSGDVYIRNLGRDADNLLDFATDNEITFRVGAADRGTWTATGLGIGTATAQKKVHIEGTNPCLRLSDSDAANDREVNGLIEFYRGNNTNRVGYLAMDSDSNDIMALATEYAAGILQFRTGSGVAAMTIDAAQNAGIGLATIDANYKLIVRRATDVNFGIGLQSSELALSAFNDAISANVPMRFYASEYNFINGNVGIGVTDPDTMLEVFKVGTQLKLSGGAADYATFGVSADGLLTVTTVDSGAALGHIALMPDGNVGIGTAAPLAKFHVNNTVGWAPSTIAHWANANVAARIHPQSGSTYNLSFGETNPAAFGLQVLDTALTGTGPLSLNPVGGNVGIGNIPACALDVTGAIRSSQVTIAANSDAVDVSGANSVLVNNSAGARTIGGLAGGVVGQVVHIFMSSANFNMTIEHNEGTGNQKILTATNADRVFTTRGGMTVVYIGSFWYEVGFA